MILYHSMTFTYHDDLTKTVTDHDSGVFSSWKAFTKLECINGSSRKGWMEQWNVGGYETLGGLKTYWKMPENGKHVNENVLITVPLKWFTDHLELDFQETKLFQSSQEQKMAPSEFHLNRSAFEFWHASHCAILLDRPFDKQMFSCTFYHSLNQSGCHEKGVRLWRLLW